MEFELGYFFMEKIKYLLYKGEGSIYNNFDDQARLRRLKTEDSEAVFQAIETNSVSSTRGVSDELGISQFRVVCHLYNHGNNIRNSRFVPQVTKILQNF